MANSCACNRQGCRACQRGSSGCAPYGVLNCLPGYHKNNCGCSFPYYTGPCAPGSEHACPDYPMPCRTGACPHPYDVSYDCGCGESQPDPGCGGAAPCALTAFAPLNVGAGGAIPLTPQEPCSSQYFSAAGGGITFNRPGAYFVSFSANIPRGVEAATTLSLRLNGGDLAPSLTAVDTRAADSAAGYTGSTVLLAAKGDVLTLRTADALSFTRATTDLPLFALTLFRLNT